MGNWQREHVFGGPEMYPPNNEMHQEKDFKKISINAAFKFIFNTYKDETLP